MIDQLPAHSRYAEAIGDDDELAEATLDDGPTETPPPPLSTWTPELAELRTISERLGVLGQLLAVLSKNRYTPPDLPRPVTARRRAWLRQNLARHHRHVAQLIPPAAEEVDDAVPG